MFDLDPKVLAELHRQASATPEQLTALLRSGEAALAEERFSDAEKILHGALIADPEHGPTWVLVGALASAWGEIDEAEFAYRRAMELEQSETACLQLAQLLASIAQFDEADSLATWLSVNADDPEIVRAASALTEIIQMRQGELAK